MPSTPTWTNADRVRELDQIEGDIAFEMGDLILEDIPWGEDGTNSGAEEAMRRYSEYTGVGYETIKDRRRTSAKVPAVARATAVRWSAYREIAKQPDDLIEVLLEIVNSTTAPTKSLRWTVSAVQNLIDQRKGNTPREEADHMPRDRPSPEPQPPRPPLDVRTRENRGDDAYHRLLMMVAGVGADADVLFANLTVPPMGEDANQAWFYLNRAKATLDRFERFLRGGSIAANTGDDLPPEIIPFRKRNGA